MGPAARAVYQHICELPERAANRRASRQAQAEKDELVYKARQQEIRNVLAKWKGAAPAEDDRVTRRLRGTVGYVAPEIVAATITKRPPGYTFACDVFALGVVLFVLLVGYPPFAGDDDDDTMKRILHGAAAWRAPDWDRVSAGARGLVERLLAGDAADRPTARALRDDAWLAAARVEPASDVVPAADVDVVPARIAELLSRRSRERTLTHPGLT